MSADERDRYYGDAPNLDGIKGHISALQSADALLLVYPTWWFGLPAMLKGWFDRVWIPGVAFRLRMAGGLERSVDQYTPHRRDNHLWRATLAALVY